MKNKEKQAQSLPIANKTNPSRPILNGFARKLIFAR